MGELKMIKFIVDEKPIAQGIHLIHNATLGCEDLPAFDDQVVLGYFANYALDYQRARINWPTEKVEGCSKCCAV